MVITDVNQVVYLGDGVTTAWPFTFRIIDATDVKLLLIDADGTETDITSDYFVDTNTNTVYYPGYAPGAEPGLADQPAPVQTGQRLVVYRELPVTQEKDLGDKWPFFVIELALDKLTMILQQIYEWWGRTLRISEGDKATHPDFDMTFPIEPGKSFRVNMEGTGFEASADPGPYAEIAMEAATTAAGAAEAAEAAVAGVVLQAQWYDTVADMRSAIIPAGITAGTKGYYSVNDGGNGTYAVRERKPDDVEDNSNIIFLENGNVAEKLHQYKSINDFVDITNAEDVFSGDLSFSPASYTQGFTYDSKRNQFVLAISLSDNSAQKLLRIDAETGAVVSTTDYTTLYHANSLAYDPNTDLIYCLATNNEIRKIDAETMSIIGTITVAETLVAIAYNEEFNVFVGLGSQTGLDYRPIYVYSNDFAVLKTIQGIKRTTQADTNGIFSYENKVGYTYLVGEIYINDIITGEYLGVVNFNAVKNEIEDYAVKDGVLYCNQNDTTMSPVNKWKITRFNQHSILWHERSNVGNFSDFNAVGLSNVDLNTLVTPGLYRINYTDSATAEACNSPSFLVHIMLTVCEMNGLLIQFARSISSTNIAEYCRYTYGDRQTWNVGWFNLYPYLNIAGGTLTGTVTENMALPSTRQAYKVRYDSLTKGSYPATANNGFTLVSVDKDDKAINGLMSMIGTDFNELRLYAYRWVSGNDPKAINFRVYDSNAIVFMPNSDNNIDLGSAQSRWKQLYAGTTTISTSDERLKDNIESIPDAVLDAWGEVGWYQYQFKDSIEEKGESRARLHTGAIAQRIESIFESHGLDANKYGLLCYDAWDAEPEEHDEDGNITQEAREAGNRYSLRYEEALAMEAAYQRRRADKLEKRIARLEAKL